MKKHHTLLLWATVILVGFFVVSGSIGGYLFYQKYLREQENARIALLKIQEDAKSELARAQMESQGKFDAEIRHVREESERAINEAKQYASQAEQRSAQKIFDLQNTVVYIETPVTTGSGVIIGQLSGVTVILTNKHVIEGVSGIEDILVRTNDQETAVPTKILVAPYDMDLAVLYLRGTYGSSATWSPSLAFLPGQSVVALGSPLGLQGSVSKGIVSSIRAEITSSSFKYFVIQTDAAINHGNSGGGLFLEQTGELIGINTYRLELQESSGLNFAIDMKNLPLIGSYEHWGSFIPTPSCFDGTQYGDCSTIHIGYYCKAGDLTPRCDPCGCEESAVCTSSGTCQVCANSGYSLFEITTTGETFCCPPGTQGYSDGTCQ